MLVIAQVGLSLLLLTGAGLFLQTLRNLRTTDLGFAPDAIVQAAVNPQAAGYTREQLPDLDRRLLERLNDAPGIHSATMATSGFRTGVSRTCCVAIQGRIPTPGEAREVQTIGIGPDYFQIMGVPLLRGRSFTSNDVASDPGSSRVAIINEAMARQYFGADAAVGRRFGWGDPPAVRYGIEVVGVARNAVYGDLRERPRPLIYFPTAVGRYLIVRAEQPPASVASIVRREVQALDRNLDVDVRQVPEILDQALVLERLLAKLSGFFGAVATLLAGIGIYGLMAYVVMSRTKEIGIRVALGAQHRRIVQGVFRETFGLVVIGMVLGTFASLATTRVVASMLFGVLPRDGFALGMAALALVVVAILASALPARRASLVEPSVALRQE
jgi:predicted permease